MECYLDVSSAVDGGRRHLSGDRLVIGRSPLSDVVLTADAQVSRTHAVLERIADHWFVRDVGSRNGTYTGTIVDHQRDGRVHLWRIESGHTC